MFGHRNERARRGRIFGQEDVQNRRRRIGPTVGLVKRRHRAHGGPPKREHIPNVAPIDSAPVEPDATRTDGMASEQIARPVENEQIVERVFAIAHGVEKVAEAGVHEEEWLSVEAPHLDRARRDASKRRLVMRKLHLPHRLTVGVHPHELTLLFAARDLHLEQDHHVAPWHDRGHRGDRR